MRLLEAEGIDVWVGGGWGVDALLGKRTRRHRDLDVALRHSDVPALRALLASHGFEDVPRDDTRACNFVLGDDRGREVDVHSFSHEEDGNLTFGMDYPRESLTGAGTIAGQRVDCISPEWLVRFHSGYELDVDDYRDVAALCERFSIELPAEFSRFVTF